MSVLDDLPRGVRSRRLDEQQTPLAAWVDPDAIAQSDVLRFDPSKVFLGVAGGSVRDTSAGRYVTGGQTVGIGDDRHVVLCAGSRAGKGRSCLIPTLLEYKGSALVLDPKGELANVTARRRAELGQRNLYRRSVRRHGRPPLPHAGRVQPARAAAARFTNPDRRCGTDRGCAGGGQPAGRSALG